MKHVATITLKDSRDSALFIDGKFIIAEPGERIKAYNSIYKTAVAIQETYGIEANYFSSRELMKEFGWDIIFQVSMDNYYKDGKVSPIEYKRMDERLIPIAYTFMDDQGNLGEAVFNVMENQLSSRTALLLEHCHQRGQHLLWTEGEFQSSESPIIHAGGQYILNPDLGSSCEIIAGTSKIRLQQDKSGVMIDILPNDKNKENLISTASACYRECLLK